MAAAVSVKALTAATCVCPSRPVHFSSQRAFLQLREDDYQGQARTIAPQDPIAQSAHHRILLQCGGHCVHQLVPPTVLRASILKHSHIAPPIPKIVLCFGPSRTGTSATFLPHPLEYVPPCSGCLCFHWFPFALAWSPCSAVVCIQMVGV